LPIQASKLDANRTLTILVLYHDRATLACDTQTTTVAEKEKLFRLISALGKPTETSLGILPPQPMASKNVIPPNGITVDQAASLPSPHRGGSQTGSHRARCRTQEPSRKWGLHLVRRNGIFYFRRRWPEKIRRLGAPEFLSRSLRTHVLAEAVKRSADLLSAIEAGENDVLSELQNSTVCEARVQSMLKEMVRSAIGSMIARQESAAPIEGADAYLGWLETETDRIRDAQRTRDWSVASAFAGEIARQNGLDTDAIEAPAVARQVLFLMRRLNELNARVERDFDDPIDVGREILLDHGLKPTRDAMKPPMVLSEAIERACEKAPQDVENKIRVIGKLALAHFGDVPVSSIVLEQSFDFLFQV